MRKIGKFVCRHCVVTIVLYCIVFNRIQIIQLSIQSTRYALANILMYRPAPAHVADLTNIIQSNARLGINVQNQWHRSGSHKSKLNWLGMYPLYPACSSHHAGTADPYLLSLLARLSTKIELCQCKGATIVTNGAKLVLWLVGVTVRNVSSPCRH